MMCICIYIDLGINGATYSAIQPPEFAFSHQTICVFALSSYHHINSHASREAVVRRNGGNKKVKSKKIKRIRMYIYRGGMDG